MRITLALLWSSNTSCADSGCIYKQATILRTGFDGIRCQRAVERRPAHHSVNMPCFALHRDFLQSGNVWHMQNPAQAAVCTLLEQ